MKRKCFSWKTVTCLTGILLMTLCSAKLHAQNPVLLECMNINKAFQAASYLSFNVKYTYAADSTPTIITDSSLALYKMHGYKYWGSMDSVEFMQNDSFQIAAYKPEHVLTLGLPSYNYERSLPMAQWDSFFVKNDFTYSIGVDGGYKKITADYDVELSPVKKIEMWYDSVTYRVNRVKYKIDQAASDETLREQGIFLGVIMVVDMVFSNYQTGQFTNSVFNSGNYFYKSGSSYVPVSPYTGYEVFITSPGL